MYFSSHLEVDIPFCYLGLTHYMKIIVTSVVPHVRVQRTHRPLAP